MIALIIGPACPTEAELSSWRQAQKAHEWVLCMGTHELHDDIQRRCSGLVTINAHPEKQLLRVLGVSWVVFVSGSTDDNKDWIDLAMSSKVNIMSLME